VRNSCVGGTEVKCFNAIVQGEGSRLYVFYHIFRVFQNPHLIHTTPRVASVTVTLPAYGAYISQRMRYSRACVQFSDFLGRVQLLTQKLLMQG
jgi:hypothetical protein